VLEPLDSEDDEERKYRQCGRPDSEIPIPDIAIVDDLYPKLRSDVGNDQYK